MCVTNESFKKSSGVFVKAIRVKVTHEVLQLCFDISVHSVIYEGQIGMMWYIYFHFHNIGLNKQEGVVFRWIIKSAKVAFVLCLRSIFVSINLARHHFRS